MLRATDETFEVWPTFSNECQRITLLFNDVLESLVKVYNETYDPIFQKLQIFSFMLRDKPNIFDDTWNVYRINHLSHASLVFYDFTMWIYIYLTSEWKIYV